MALDPRYPDWPCQQLKVPGISLANVWHGPAIDLNDTKPVDAATSDLVSRLAARRTPMEDARKLITATVAGTGEEKQDKAKTLFTALYSRLNAQRNQVMDGIERFRASKRRWPSDPGGNPEAARPAGQGEFGPGAGRCAGEPAGLADAHFEDRRKSTSYVCDVPVLIEKRLFDLGSAIQPALNADAPKP